MLRAVYCGGKQYQTVPALVESIVATWNTVSRAYISTLYKLLINRLISVIARKVKITVYLAHE